MYMGSMDFGALDGLVVCSGNNNNNNINSDSMISVCDLDPKSKWGHGSGGGFFKQERATQDEWKEFKVAKVTHTQDDFSKPMLLQQQRSAYSDAHNMLSFSSPKTHPLTLHPYYDYATNTEGSMIAGVRGPFTPSQWMELEHQALIYKYITANAPIPSNLLIPIRKALESAAFSAYPGAHLRHNAFGWGAFHLGFSNSSDPEPGRCRRTDGKKWRCARDAVADQKYCERHMNRGRHRSRKPVEGQRQTTGHSVSNGCGSTTTTPKLPTSGTTILGHQDHHQPLPDNCSGCMNMQPGSTPNPAVSSQEKRNFLNKAAGVGIDKIQDGMNLSMLSTSTSTSTSSTGLKENQLAMPKEPPAHSHSEFGLVCSDSLLNPLQKSSTKSQNCLRQFMDDWPHSESEQTQLSISIPIGPASSSDFMPSTSSPSNERVNLSPLRMGLGMGNNSSSTTTSTVVFNKNNQRSQAAANWNPISWETLMGGPLGEVLHHTHSTNNSPSPSVLNLMTEGWDSTSTGSPRMGMAMALSPTGVLQKTAFGSLSNSSAGSSPVTENNILGSTLMGSSLPSFVVNLKG